MELSWFQSILLGFLSGMAEILPISGEAHRIVALKLFGNGVTADPLVELFLHIGTLIGLYLCCRSHIARIMRAYRLSRVPKKRRRRPLDTRSILDFKLLLTTLVPSVGAFLFYERTAAMASDLTAVALALFVNGLILYIPQYLPGANKDARTLSPVDGLLIGLGGAASTVPGISCIGAGVSIATVRGADKQYAFSIALLMTVPVTMGYIVMDLLTILGGGFTVSLGLLVKCMLSGLAAFGGISAGIQLLRHWLSHLSMSIFGFYCWGLSLFTFILYLTAA